jgi:hypothetical protein
MRVGDDAQRQFKGARPPDAPAQPGAQARQVCRGWPDPAQAVGAAKATTPHPKRPRAIAQNLEADHRRTLLNLHLLNLHAVYQSVGRPKEGEPLSQAIEENIGLLTDLLPNVGAGLKLTLAAGKN